MRGLEKFDLHVGWGEFTRSNDTKFNTITPINRFLQLFLVKNNTLKMRFFALPLEITENVPLTDRKLNALTEREFFPDSFDTKCALVPRTESFFLKIVTKIQ